MTWRGCVVIRKSSYYVSIPGSVRVGVHGSNPTVLLVRGPLGRVAVHVSSESCFSVENSYLKWTRVLGYSKRSELSQRVYNNNLKKLLSKLFDRLNSPDSSSFKLIGRGYKILWSKSSRLIHLELGFTQKKVVPLPKSVNLRVKDRYNFNLTGLNSSELRVLANRVRALRPPNPYTAKGTLLNGEVVNTKQGKKTQY